jgi:SAM-dependent methyltransferase
MVTERYEVPDDEVAVEQERLRHLGGTRDRRTFRIIDRIGISEGSTCLEVGAGAGTVSRGLAERVGPQGTVWSIDQDLRFHDAMPANVDIRQLDLVSDTIPESSFDFIHARAVLQHIPEREAVLDRLVVAVKPGGWLLVEDSDMRAFAEQPLPEPFATVHRILASGAGTPWRDPHYGTRLVAHFGERSMLDIGVDGATGLMRPGESSGEWWFLAIDRVLPHLVEASTITAAQADRCREQMRAPDLVMLGPLMLGVWGRRD